MNIEEVKSIIDEHGIRTVIVAGTDPCGVLRGKRLTVPYFFKALDGGVHFSSYLMSTTTMDEVLPGLFDGGVPDVKGVPDLSSFRVASWEEGAAICLMDWHDVDGTPSPMCPRGQLKRHVARLREKKLKESFALEFEFYLVPKPIKDIRMGQWDMPELASRDIHCYSVYEGHFWEPIIGAIRDYFPEEVESCLPEWGQGQFEINLHRSDALAMADTTVMFKIAIKQMAARAGMSATFMAKLHEECSGNSGHIHQSLAHLETGESAFFDAAQPHCMSPLFQSYVAGLLDVFHSSTLFFAPFVNSYKRFQPDSFAGVMRTWGIDNRTVSLRVINEDAAKCRVEHRVGGADLNPYVAFSTLLGAGLRGVDKELPLEPPHEGNTYSDATAETVPLSLAQAIDAAESDPRIREVLSPAMVDNLLRIARFEAGVFDQTVTDLERRRYYEMA
ncbi:MAG TPA: glutamine synthetase family protein [Arenicellales bacterium]|nr:glutamine synthetase family protein [Arenicellales bacterium]